MPTLCACEWCVCTYLSMCVEGGNTTCHHPVNGMTYKFMKGINVFKALLPCKEASQLIPSDLVKLKALEGLLSSSWILIHILQYSDIYASHIAYIHICIQICCLQYFLWIPIHITKHKKTSNKIIQMWEKESDKKLHLVTGSIPLATEWTSDEYSSCIGSCCETGSCAVFLKHSAFSTCCSTVRNSTLGKPGVIQST